MKKNIIIINPGPSAIYLSQSLANLGFHSIAVFTECMERRDKYFQVGQEIFDQQCHFDNPSLNELIDAIRPYHPVYIINGSDDSAPITDHLMQALLPKLANNPSTAQNRCDKFCMQEALHHQGLPYIQQIKVAKKNLATLNLDKIRFPCFCKPTHGIATMGGFKAENAASFRESVGKNAHINSSPEYLIQEFIVGEEFVVDSFSFQGQHFISSVQKYHKRLIDGTPTYCYCEIVSDPHLWNTCANFVKNCLNATDLKNGFAHTEIFRLEDGSFRLCEVNPRISGIKGYYNQLAKITHLYTQPEILAMCLRSEGARESSLSERKNFGRFLCLYNFSNHPLQDPKNNLRAFHSVKFYDLLKPLGTLPAQGPKNLAETDLFVLLAHEDVDVIHQETQAILSLESEGKLL